MNTETIIEEPPEEKILVTTPFPEPWWGKMLYGLFVVVMPIVAFWATELFKPEWQSGQLSAYLILLLFPESSLPFFVLLAYSILSYCLLLIDAARYSQMHVVRFGIYAGVVLAFQYSVLAALFLFIDSPSWNSLYVVALWLLPVFSPKVYRWLINKWGAKLVNNALLILVSAGFLINVLVMRSPLAPLTLVLVVLTIAAPFWSFLLALQAAVWLFRSYGSRLTFPRAVGLATWIAGYIAAWRFDILKMYELYAALPPEPPPDCYIATAAARGHPQLVGSRSVKRASGEIMQVNQQLQILKCTELALMAIHPRFHKTLRRVYDNVGRSLAKRLCNPLLADAAFLLLKPCDWLAHRVLRGIIPEIDSISNKMYTN